MLKKLLCIVALMLALVCVLASCSDDAEHIHEYGAWSTTVEATCTENGSEFRVCACGKKEVRSITALGHRYGEWVPAEEVTCLETVSATRVCVCGKVDNGSVVGLHDKVDGVCTLCYEGKYIYTQVSGGYRIDGLVGESGTELVIPPSYNGLPIKAINDYAFYGCTDVVSVKFLMPAADENGKVNAIASIGVSAFYGCTALESIEIPATISSIGKYAFFGCEALAEVAFDAVKPEKISKDSSYAALSVGAQAFFGCENISAVSAADIAAFCEINFEDETANPLYYSESLYLDKKVSELVIPAYVEYVGSYAFANNAAIESIVIADGVKSIGNCAFLNCDGIAEINVPASVKSVGSSAFENCSELEYVEFAENGTTIIGSRAFRDCSELYEVYLPNKSLLSLGAESFMNCSSLYAIAIPERVKAIEYSTFQNCYSLDTLIMSDSVESIGNLAFYNCHDLTDVVITSIRSWCEIDFENETSNPLTYASYLDLDGEVLTDLVVPNGTKKISSYAFKGYALESVVIPGSVYSIGKSAFEDCESLASIDMFDGVAKIGAGAFKNCASLASISLKGSIVEIGKSAFELCTALVDVEIKDGVSYIGDSAFKYCTSIASLTVPDSVLTIGASAFEECIEMEELAIGAKISSIGDSAFKGCVALSKLEVPDGVTAIGKSAFEGCTGISVLYVSKSLETAGEGAFAGCINISVASIPCAAIGSVYVDNLSSLTINAGASIPDSAFKGCELLENVVIADSVTSVASNAFSGCSALATAEVPLGAVAAMPRESIKKITVTSGESVSASAFNGCVALEEVVLAPSITTLEKDSFVGCANLTSATMSAAAFSNATNTNLKNTLTVAIISDGETIVKESFKSFSKLTTVVIPTSVTVIEASAFAACRAITDIYYLGTAEQWASVSVATGGNSTFVKAAVHFIAE